MTVIERKLAEKCDSYGLPHDFDTLMRHMENNHAAALGACRDLAESRRRKLEGAVEALRAAQRYIERGSRLVDDRSVRAKIKAALVDAGGQ